MASPLANDNDNNSRPPDLPCRRKASRGASDLNRSNSTASIFLGGARKSWMSTGNNHPHPERNNHNPSVSTPASRPLLPSTAPAPAPAPPPPSRTASPPAVCSSAPSPLVTAVSSPSPTRPAGMRNFPSPSQQNFALARGNHSPATSFTPATRNVQIPPVSNNNNTPPSLTDSPASRPQSLPMPVEARLQQQKQQAHLQQQSASSLPSPDPTIPPRSHTSPIIAIENNGVNGPPRIASPSTTAFPSPPLQQGPSVQQRSRPGASVVGVAPVSLPSNQQTVSAHRGNAHVGPYTPPVHSHPAPTAPIPAAAPPPPQQQQNVALRSSTPNGSSSIITNEFFVRARMNLEAFAVNAGQSILISETVEVPRVHLLLYACSERDLIYLVLHQIYCLSSYAPTQFVNLPGFSNDHNRGLDVVRNLLVDNHLVSGSFLQWCIHFPYSLPELMKDPVYLQALRRVQSVLTGFVDSWAALENKTRVNDHPPLVEDMVKSLGVMSVVLQFNMFLCLCRRIPGARLESQLQDIFLRDVDYFKRSLVERTPADQRCRENNHIVSLYSEAIGLMRRNATGSPRVAAPNLNPPASNQAVSASAPVRVTQPTTQNPPPSHAQLHSGTQVTNDIGSPRVVARPKLPRQPSSGQLLMQQRGGGLQVLSSQTTGMVSSPVMVAASSHMARRDLPQGHIAQQPSRHPGQRGPQSVRAFQPPHHPTHMPVGYRVQRPNVQPMPPQQPQQSQRIAIPLLPPPNVPPVINTRPNPNRLAIHQAHLRDPVNQFISLDATGEKQTELLPYMTSFLVEPNVLCEPDRAIKWRVGLSEETLNRRPIIQSQGQGQRMLRKLKEGSEIYRLRCIKVPRTTTKLSEHSWSVTETTWPTAIYVYVNNKEHLPRRKIHNTRNLALDITLALQPGSNNINVHFILGPAEQKDFNYAVAVETLTFRPLAHAKTLAQPLPAAASQKRINGRLARDPSDEDDELRIVSDDLKVTLIDPFTARLFEVPVRGRHCQHTECFDHDTFLQTHALKSGDRSPIEAGWRCPICRLDARPQSLIVDGFLANVRKELERTNRCDGARALQIKADGTWEVKTDEDLPKGTPQPSHTAAKRKPTNLENTIHQRPKIDRSPSFPMGILNPVGTPNQSSEVIILD